MVYYVIALGLFRSVSAREVLGCLVDGLRWIASSMRTYRMRWRTDRSSGCLAPADEVKTYLLGPGAVLRSKTPHLVRQEVDGLMLAYYAVRRLIHAAARHADEDPDRLSFVHAVRVIRRRVQNPGAFPPTGPR